MSKDEALPLFENKWPNFVDFSFNNSDTYFRNYNGRGYPNDWAPRVDGTYITEAISSQNAHDKTEYCKGASLQRRY